MLSTALLRDARRGCWHLYAHPLAVFSTNRIAEVLPLLTEVERRARGERLFAVGFVSYGAAAGFDPALPRQRQERLPLICFALFRDRTTSAHAEDFSAHFPVSTTAPANWQLQLNEQQFQAGVQALRGHIGAGETYQVNFTARLEAAGQLDFATFLRMAVDAPYAAYLEGESFSIASASPELLFDAREGIITCRPMKGTAHRGLDSERDAAAAQWLQHSAKNRAENLMITDMVRNDLGRLAVPGTVQVPALFAIERYPTVWQMTSTVTARSDACLTTLFTALFPAASITGAPKRAAMAFINAYEAQPREVYTGSIGVLEPDRACASSVAIRTAWTDKQSNSSFYGAGCGIVWDSRPAEEYAELLAKTRVLHAGQQDFALLETMLWRPDAGIDLHQGHLTRLLDSARYFGFAACADAVTARFDEIAAQAGDEPRRVRLLLHRDGSMDVQSGALPEMDETPQKIALARTAVDHTSVFLYHKTTCREVYEAAAREVPADCEALLFNQHGFVTESTIANVVYSIDGTLYTPPIADGLLPGTRRRQLLEDGVIHERALSLEEVDVVERWYLINALRGWRRAELHREDDRVQNLLFS